MTNPLNGSERYIKYPTGALYRSGELTRAEQRLYNCLLTLTWKHHFSTSDPISITKLALKSGMSRNHVCKAIKGLREKCFIDVTRSRLGTVYGEIGNLECNKYTVLDMD